MRTLFLRGLVPGMMVAFAALNTSAEEPGHPLDPSVGGTAIEVPSPKNRHLDLFGGPLRERDTVSPSYEEDDETPSADAGMEGHDMDGMMSGQEMKGMTPGQEMPDQEMEGMMSGQEMPGHDMNGMMPDQQMPGHDMGSMSGGGHDG